ncbi:MAG: hypothetical protein AAB225_12250 [Acidobacteriota bacterium]
MGEVQQRLLGALAAAVLAALPASARKFYADDPIQKEPKPVRVEKAHFRKLSDYFDFFLNTFSQPGEEQTRRRLIPAQGVNTLGEVPDGAWYVNRHGRTPMSMEELVRGPETGNPPSMAGPWTVRTVKTEGITPGLTIRDARGKKYWLKFDPLTNPGMATTADVIGTTFFHALGYHVPEYYLVRFDRRQLLITEKSVIADAMGKERRLAGRDVDEVLLDVPRDKDNKYLAVASLAVPGEGLGQFRYYGTRSDDPNDVVPHEHRRDLRGLFVFCAWLGHKDSKSLNTYDSLVEEAGVRYIKHYLMDFGSILGSAAVRPTSPREGNEHLFAVRPAVIQFVSLGLYAPRWARAHFPHLPAVGRFEYEVFEPEKYKTNYPNPGFENRLPDDTFWAARQVMMFSAEQIRAIVKKGEFSDPKAGDWLATCLIKRRDKIGRAYFAKVLPLDRIQVRDGRLEFEDLAVKYEFHPPRQYSIQWSQFDNEAESRTPIPGQTGLAVPPETGEYFAAEVRAEDPKKTVIAYFRRKDGRIELAGLDRTW